MNARDRARISFEDTRRALSLQGVMRLRHCCLPIRIKHLCAIDTAARNELMRQTLTRIYRRSPAVLAATKNALQSQNAPTPGTHASEPHVPTQLLVCSGTSTYLSVVDPESLLVIHNVSRAPHCCTSHWRT